MIRLLSILLVLGCLSANAADWITATVHVSTNAPLGNTNTLVINGTTLTFTNSVTASPSTLIQETNSVTYTATNILNQLTTYKISPGYYLSQTSSTNVTVRGLVGGPMVVTLAGFWGHVTYSTQTVQTPTIVVRVPVSNEAATNRVTIANGLAQALSDYATTALATNANVSSNLVQKGAGPTQYVLSEMQFYSLVRMAYAQLTNANLINSTNSGFIAAITNGYWTNAILGSPKMTNGANYGLPFRSPGGGTSSEQFGTLANAFTNFALAIGYGANAGWSSFAGGYLANAADSNSVAVGAGADVTGMSAVGIGQSTSVSGYKAGAFGQAAISDYENSTAVGQGSQTTKSNQVLIGASTHAVTIPGVLEAAAQTNSVLRGTNVVNGRVDFTARSNSSLVNGYNSGVVVGTNVYIRFSGPSGAYTNAGFVAPGGPQYFIAQFDNPGLSFTLLNESGLEATAENRIMTGTGALLNSTNNPVLGTFIYDDSASRYRVISFR